MEKKIWGISVRTTNANEFNPETARIGALYQAFDKKVPVDYKNGARVYGVYYDYESDHKGEFSVLAGTDQLSEPAAETLQQITLKAGDYLVFNAKGQVPQVVIETWAKIWDYFSNPECEYQRAYTSDFEHYKSQDEVDICIAVK
jgi:predicted transcriptional regulator YdeE